MRTFETEIVWAGETRVATVGYFGTLGSPGTRYDPPEPAECVVESVLVNGVEIADKLPESVIQGLESAAWDHYSRMFSDDPADE